MSRRRRYVVNSNNNDPLIDSTKDDDFDENVSYFLSHLKMKGRSVYTILYYKRELRKFMVTLEEGGVATRLRRLTSDIIMDEYRSEERRVGKECRDEWRKDDKEEERA